MDFSKEVIETERLLIRTLTVGDVTERYLSWMTDGHARKYISAAQYTRQIDDLRHYVDIRTGKKDVWFCAILDKSRNVHIGNIKYEPILPNFKCAVMGILIGDPEYRGKGIFREVFFPTAELLGACCDIESIYLGVDVGNAVAVNAYRAVGFVAADITDEQRGLLGNVTMKYSLHTSKA